MRLIAVFEPESECTKTFSRLLKYIPSISMSSIDINSVLSVSTMCTLKDSHSNPNGKLISATPKETADLMPKWKCAALLLSVDDSFPNSLQYASYWGFPALLSRDAPVSIITLWDLPPKRHSDTFDVKVWVTIATFSCALNEVNM